MHQAGDLVLARLAGRGVHAMAMERVPRTTRAQSMDALSSQATLAGYVAVLLGAAVLPRILPMMTTAAGPPASARSPTGARFSAGAPAPLCALRPPRAAISAGEKCSASTRGRPASTAGT